jgi:hypothetical protein
MISAERSRAQPDAQATRDLREAGDAQSLAIGRRSGMIIHHGVPFVKGGVPAKGSPTSAGGRKGPRGATYAAYSSHQAGRCTGTEDPWPPLPWHRTRQTSPTSGTLRKSDGLGAGSSPPRPSCDRTADGAASKLALRRGRVARLVGYWSCFHCSAGLHTTPLWAPGRRGQSVSGLRGTGSRTGWRRRLTGRGRATAGDDRRAIQCMGPRALRQGHVAVSGAPTRSEVEVHAPAYPHPAPAGTLLPAGPIRRSKRRSTGQGSATDSGNPIPGASVDDGEPFLL